MTHMVRPTADFVLRPQRYLETDRDWSDFDFDVWSYKTYDWEQDDWNGLKDTVQTVTLTIETGAGDCDDYALVAASYLKSETNHDCEIVALYSKFFRRGHLIVYDISDETVYSSGSIFDKTLDEYVARSAYHWTINRKI